MMKRKSMAILLALTLTASSLTACASAGGQGAAQESAQPAATAPETAPGTEQATERATAQDAAPETGGTSETAQPATQAAGTAAQSAQTGSSISADGAKAIALDHAGVAESGLIAVIVTEERDDGMDLYQVDFYTAEKDFEYEIEKNSGRIMSIDTDLNDLSWSTPSGASFTKEQAIDAVLAKVPGSTQDNLRMKAERDDGRTVYEGEVIVSDRKYDFEIDAQDGAFLEWTEKVFPAQAAGQAEGSGQAAAQSAGTPEQTALQTALADSGVAPENVLASRVKQDMDDGQTRYDVEIYAVNADYEYELDETGTRILERERESYSLDWNTPSGASFTKEQAVDAVLAKVAGSTQNNLRMEAERDDGRTVYEGEVIADDRKYEFEIDASTGTFLEWNEEALFY